MNKVIRIQYKRLAINFIGIVMVSCLFSNKIIAQSKTKTDITTRICIHTNGQLRVNGAERAKVRSGDTVKIYFKTNNAPPYKVVVYEHTTKKDKLVFPVKESDTRSASVIDFYDEPGPSTPSPIDSLAAMSILNLDNDMILVKGGDYLMGLIDTADIEGGDGSRPQHKVILSNFYISKYEVTQALWMSVMDSNPSVHKGCYMCPVENVSWNQVQIFLAKLNTLTKYHYRLPTEAEWEYAARGGANSKGYYYSGSNDPDDVAWYRNLNGTQKVALKKPNELGLYDMSGNISEWCSDWFADYSGNAPVTNPTGPKDGYLKIIRGGNSIGLVSGCYVFMRAAMLPAQPDKYIGFRLVRDVK
jgi:formylglycine-generating enzyme required for sulfatase activity